MWVVEELTLDGHWIRRGQFMRRQDAERYYFILERALVCRIRKV